MGKFVGCRIVKVRTIDVKLIPDIVQIISEAATEYFKDIAIAVRCKIIEGNMNFISWFELKDKLVRRGILIKKR
ncbi:MAG: hypothetical protein LBS69_05065 [Prevotellaceae bacterium]|nr:hypothetical protein [Prevotellaceae bacterium]